jgi:hypothetical protein
VSEFEADSAMASGSDAGRPGGRHDGRPLQPDEEALLGELQQAGGEPVGSFPEESDAAGGAASDEAPLPAEGGPQDDGLVPEFEAPGDRSGQE